MWAVWQRLLSTSSTLWVSGRAWASHAGTWKLSSAAAGSSASPACEVCGGVLKPDVVFFGENVPAERVQEAWSLYEEADVLLVAGSSLTVYSGRRFIYRAEKDGIPIAIINIGPTRADELAAARVEGRLGDVLPALADELLG